MCYVTRFVRGKSWGSLGASFQVRWFWTKSNCQDQMSRNTTSPQTRILQETRHPSCTLTKNTSEADPDKQKPVNLRYFISTMSTTNQVVSKKRKTDDACSSNKKSYEELESQVEELKQLLSQTQEKLKQALEESSKNGSNDNDGGDDDDVSDGEDSVNMDSTDAWMMNYVQLREYFILNGNCQVPSSANKKLHKWIANQKLAYVNKKISPERIALLDGLGLSWGKKFPTPRTWDEQFQDLVKYKNATGNCNVVIHATNPSNLAKWVSTQRSEYKRFRKGQPSLLTMEQMGQLKSLGFKWNGPRLSKLK